MGAGVSLAPIRHEFSRLGRSHRADLNCRRRRSAVVCRGRFDDCLRVIGAADDTKAPDGVVSGTNSVDVPVALVPAARFAAAGEPSSLIEPSANWGVVER
jgi:hypothetical protein